MKKKPVLILGCGPAGMACALELNNNNKAHILIEKDNAIGGFAKTLEFKEGIYRFRTDIGPHRFFSKNKYLYKIIEDLIKKDWILVPRKTQQFIHKKYYDYPINAIQALQNIGLINTISMGISYLKSIIVYSIFKKKINNFEEYIISKFGKKLGEFNMLNYTKKIWGLNCSKIHPDWARQRIKGLDIISTLKNTIFKNNKQPKTLIDQFYYPKFGTGLIYETIAKKIKIKGNRIYTRSYPTKIMHKNNIITKVEINKKGKIDTIYPSYVMSSIPITEFIKILNPKPPTEIIKASNRLKWRSQIYLFITLNKEKISQNNWIYFPDTEIPFSRISEMKNFSKFMSPKRKSSLLIEFFVDENDQIWKMNKREIYDLAMKYFKRLRLFSAQDVRNFYVFKKKFVYPIYGLDYKNNLKIVKKYLDNFENLFYIGRPGRFQYTNQDHSLEMGIISARSIIEKKKYDLNQIGSEKEYFEKGFIKNK